LECDDTSAFAQPVLPPEKPAEMLESLRAGPDAALVAETQVMAAEDQPAFVHIGQRVPATRTQVTEKPESTGVEPANVGLMLGVKARVNKNNPVTTEVDLEKSQVARGPSTHAGGSGKELILIVSPQLVDSGDSFPLFSS